MYINRTVMVKGEHRYIVLYEDGREEQALQSLGRWAANEELSFTWIDAAKLCQRIRQVQHAQSTRNLPWP